MSLKLLARTITTAITTVTEQAGCVSGGVVSNLHMLIHLLFAEALQYILLLPSFHIRGNWGTGRLSNLPKATQLVCGRARIQGSEPLTLYCLL